ALGRYRLELEIAVFRIVQEALSNVHRHSKSETAQITLIESPRHLRLKVEDRGRGMSLPIPGLEKDDANMPGVGISGIRERVRQLGGQMQIRYREWGTSLEVFFPAESSSEAASSEAAGASHSAVHAAIRRFVRLDFLRRLIARRAAGFFLRLKLRSPFATSSSNKRAR